MTSFSASIRWGLAGEEVVMQVPELTRAAELRALVAQEKQIANIRSLRLVATPCEGGVPGEAPLELAGDELVPWDTHTVQAVIQHCACLYMETCSATTSDMDEFFEEEIVLPHHPIAPLDDAMPRELAAAVKQVHDAIRTIPVRGRAGTAFGIHPCPHVGDLQATLLDCFGIKEGAREGSTLVARHWDYCFAIPADRDDSLNFRQEVGVPKFNILRQITEMMAAFGATFELSLGVESIDTLPELVPTMHVAYSADHQAVLGVISIPELMGMSMW